MRDKTALSAALGCASPWHHHGHIGQTVVDNGSAFVDAGFRAAISDLGIDYMVTPAGIPKMRARVERVFGTQDTKFLSRLPGRTFGNVVERGDHPAERLATLTAEDLIPAMTAYIVDEYHNRPHSGLNGATPNQMWDKLGREVGVPPARSSHDLRAILGMSLERRSGRHGIRFAGLHYHSERLARRFMQHGGEDLTVQIDPEDFGWISCWFEDSWHVLGCTYLGARGLSHRRWRQSVLELRHGYRNASLLIEDVVDKAIARNKTQIDAFWMRLGPDGIAPTQADIERAEDEVFLGLDLDPAFGDEQPITVVTPDTALPGFPGQEIPPTRSTPTEHSTTTQPKHPGWRFDDDQS